MMWAELVFFVVFIGLAAHQLYSVKKAQRERIEKERAEAAASAEAASLKEVSASAEGRDDRSEA